LQSLSSLQVDPFSPGSGTASDPELPPELAPEPHPIASHAATNHSKLARRIAAGSCSREAPMSTRLHPVDLQGVRTVSRSVSTGRRWSRSGTSAGVDSACSGAGRLQPRIAVGLVALVLAIAFSAGVRAQPRVHFEVSGTCPSEADVVSAFGEQVLASVAAEQDAWRVQVHDGSAEGATLLLRTPRGELASTRSIRSSDCAALAQAFAFIVLAHFVELRLIEPQVAPEVADEPAPPSQTTPALRAQQRAEPRTEPGPTAALELGVALGAGLGLGVAPSSAAPTAELALGLGPPRGGWLGQIGVRVSTPVQQESATDRVEHWATGARLELGGRVPLTRRVWFAAGAGGAIALARVTALDLDRQPATLRFWPAASASIAVGLALWPTWSLRWATAAQLFPRRDRYRIEPEGVVAEAPRADVVTTLGLQFDTLL
jgi:hypothetical protein